MVFAKHSRPFTRAVYLSILRIRWENLFLMSKKIIFSILRFVIRVLMRLVARVEVHGMEKLPASGGYIVVANHLGRMDIPLVYGLLDRDDVILLVAEKYRKYAIVRWLVKKVDALWLERFSADFSALRNTLVRLKAGGVLEQLSGLIVGMNLATNGFEVSTVGTRWKLMCVCANCGQM